MMMYVADRITISQDLCNGKPTIRGMAITVRTVLEYFFAGDSREEILYQYPDLEAADIDACLNYVLAITDHRHTILPLAA